MQLIGDGGERINKSIGGVESTLEGIREKFTIIEGHAGMAERLVRDLAIKEALRRK